MLAQPTGVSRTGRSRLCYDLDLHERQHADVSALSTPRPTESESEGAHPRGSLRSLLSTRYSRRRNRRDYRAIRRRAHDPLSTLQLQGAARARVPRATRAILVERMAASRGHAACDHRTRQIARDLRRVRRVVPRRRLRGLHVHQRDARDAQPRRPNPARISSGCSATVAFWPKRLSHCQTSRARSIRSSWR